MRGKCPAVIIVNIMQSNGAGVDKIDNSHRSVSSTVNWHELGCSSCWRQQHPTVAIVISPSSQPRA
jgi:hypothetical protein